LADVLTAFTRRRLVVALTSTLAAREIEDLLSTPGGATESFTTIQADSGTSPVADTATDTLTLSGSTYINTVGDAVTDTIQIDLDSTALIASLDTLYQPLDADLTAIAALGFTATAFLKKTAANTWALDTNTYLTSSALTGYALLDGTNHPFTYVKTPKIYPNADSTTSLQFLKADGTTSIVNIDTTNSRVGIGTTAPTSKLHIDDTVSSAVDYITASIVNAVTITTNTYGNTGLLVGANTLGTRTSDVTIGIQNVNNYYSSGLCTDQYGMYCALDTQGPVTTQYGVFLVNGAGGGGTVVNSYGLYVNDINVGSSLNYAIYTGAGKVRFGDSVGVGLNPTAVLHLKAGTATASTAPLKFTTGTLNTVAEAGAVEFLTDSVYYTTTTSTIRKTVDGLVTRNISALRTLDGSDNVVNCTANTFTVTLPTAVGFTGEYIIKNSGTGVITVDGNASETIDGALTVVLAVQYSSVTIRSNGTNWIILY